MDETKQVILFAINQEDSIFQKRIWQDVRNVISQKDTLIRWGNNRLFWMHTFHQSKQIKPDFLKAIQHNCESNFFIELHIGIGDIAASHELYRSYEQALTALHYSTNSRISYHTDLQLELCLYDISDETKKEFITRTIGDLMDHKQLFETLKAFLENESSLQKTADTLFIHINTLHYRLSRIHQMTGLDPKRFKDLVNLYLANMFLEEHTMFP
ncbi:PucR family transcriptional regulator [Lentibacillus cibarius]|uniref:PucR family transcriptional regulator n=1 Tax=Lentibacillus cibarius TaxID=2583219 RepID=UPI001F168157|nr:helix-turn-helix domain-containing protein [Lentibacillus cibarius]